MIKNKFIAHDIFEIEYESYHYTFESKRKEVYAVRALKDDGVKYLGGLCVRPGLTRAQIGQKAMDNYLYEALNA